MRLPKQIENHLRAPEVLLRLTSDLQLLWPGGTLLVPDVVLDDALLGVLRAATDDGRILRGLERATKALDAQERGLDRADRNAGVTRGERISRLLLLANDGADRFYRHVESVLHRHGGRALAVRLDVDAHTLGDRLFGKGALAKLVMLDHKEAVAAALLAIGERRG